jgi:hypothetical protein
MAQIGTYLFFCIIIRFYNFYINKNDIKLQLYARIKYICLTTKFHSMMTIPLKHYFIAVKPSNEIFKNRKQC